MDRTMVESTDLAQRVNTIEALIAEIRTEFRWLRWLRWLLFVLIALSLPNITAYIPAP